MTNQDLTGDWNGFYEQAGARCGIAMHVVQRGQSFVGSMRDANTLTMTNLEFEAGELPAVMRDLGQPEMVTSLPEHSTIEGEVEGERVSFQKRYRGSQNTTVWFGGTEVMRIEIQEHSVFYRGRLDRGAGVLRGEWSIRCNDGGPDERGAFVLRRQQAGGASGARSGSAEGEPQ